MGGVISRNCEGEIIVAMRMPKFYVSAPVLCSLEGRAMELCMEIEIQEVIFEGDTFSVINYVKDAVKFL